MPCARRLPILLLLLLLVGCGGAPLDPDAPALPAPATAPTAAPSTAPRPTATTPSTTPNPAPAPDPHPTATGEPATTPTPEELGTFAVDLAPEVSGIVTGRRDPALLWLVDDGPGTTSVVAVRHDGTLVTRVQMEGVDGRDVEDIAAGPCGADDPSPCLYVGDIGDNLGSRDAIRIHRFPEPPADAIATPVETASYTLPGGAVDAEALVMTADGLPVVLTKEEGVARVLAATAFADGELVEVAALPLPQPASALLTTFAGLTVTAADLSPDGGRLLLRTYDSVVELTAPSPGAPLSGIADWPAVELPVAFEGQGEAIAYLPDGRSYVTASEGSGVLSVVRR